MNIDDGGIGTASATNGNPAAAYAKQAGEQTNERERARGRLVSLGERIAKTCPAAKVIMGAAIIMIGVSAAPAPAHAGDWMDAFTTTLPRVGGGFVGQEIMSNIGKGTGNEIAKAVGFVAGQTIVTKFQTDWNNMRDARTEPVERHERPAVLPETYSDGRSGGGVRHDLGTGRAHPDAHHSWTPDNRAGMVRPAPPQVMTVACTPVQIKFQGGEEELRCMTSDGRLLEFQTYHQDSLANANQVGDRYHGQEHTQNYAR